MMTRHYFINRHYCIDHMTNELKKLTIQEKLHLKAVVVMKELFVRQVKERVSTLGYRLKYISHGYGTTFDSHGNAIREMIVVYRIIIPVDHLLELLKTLSSSESPKYCQNPSCLPCIFLQKTISQRHLHHTRFWG